MHSAAPESTGEPTSEAAPPAPGRRRTVVAIAAGCVAFAAIAAAVWVLGADDEKPAATATTSATPGAGAPTAGVPARVVTAAKLREIAAASASPIYWAGTRPATRLEYTQTQDGSTYVRYLTGSAEAGSPSGRFAVVATYPQPNAFARVSEVARRTGLPIRLLADDGIAVSRPGRPQNLYVVYPKLPYQIEVYAANLATAEDLVFRGRIRPVR